MNPQPQQQQQQEEFILDEYVYYEPLTNFRKSQIIQNGIAIVTATHETGCCQDSITFLESLPESFQFQVVVEILEGEENALQASSLRGNFEGEIENQRSILLAACRAVISAPPDCGIILIGGQNST